ncbi:MAG: sugar phosphate isomerase/epimerase family protein [bacterium]
MKFGCCATIDRVNFLAESGYDYIELGVSWLASLRDEDFERHRDALKRSGIGVSACNLFLPREIKVAGPEVDRKGIEAYLDKATRRVSAIGCPIIVFGSGGSRSFPEGFPRERAWEQLKWFLSSAADFAGPRGIRIAIEPLNRRESNILNSVKEAYALAGEVGRPEVNVLADLYHVMMEDEPLSHIVEAKDKLIHIHVADGNDRLYPGGGDYDYAAFKRALDEASYDSGISAECRWENFEEEAPKALKYMKERLS